MKSLYSFDDVLISPKFSFVRSRKDVDTTINFFGTKLTTPIISSNMDSVTGPLMASAMIKNGAQACLHRFYPTIKANVEDFITGSFYAKPMVSVGLGTNEFERAVALVEAGAEILVIDVAHGAQISVVEQYNRLREKFDDNIRIVVGNFANSSTINDFNQHSAFQLEAVKVGIGNGAACTTRLKTGVGIPQLSAIMDIRSTGLPIIADGGCKTAGDVAKAIAAGASAVMMGRMLAGTDESPGEVMYKHRDPHVLYDSFRLATLQKSNPEHFVKKYRGSASAESYATQGKSSDFKTAEGESYLVPYTGSVVNILNDINGGLRSAMSYVGASTIKEFRANAEFVMCSTLSIGEAGAHGKTQF